MVKSRLIYILLAALVTSCATTKPTITKRFSAEQCEHVSIVEYVLTKDVVIDLSELKGDSHYPADGHITSNYGSRGGGMHTGIDIKGDRGDKIYALFDGIVRMSKSYSAYGNCVVIRHESGLETLYSHASKLLVKPNERVKAGDVIALVGRTGRATGDHLHFEVRMAGQYFDPNLILDTNKRKLKSDKLYLTMRSGQIIASNSEIPEETKKEIKEQKKRSSKGKYHTVKRGDGLFQLARKYDTSVDKLCGLNNISASSTLSIGQKIRIK